MQRSSPLDALKLITSDYDDDDNDDNNYDYHDKVLDEEYDCGGNDDAVAAMNRGLNGPGSCIVPSLNKNNSIV